MDVCVKINSPPLLIPLLWGEDFLTFFCCVCVFVCRSVAVDVCDKVLLLRGTVSSHSRSLVMAPPHLAFPAPTLDTWLDIQFG